MSEELNVVEATDLLEGLMDDEGYIQEDAPQETPQEEVEEESEEETEEETQEEEPEEEVEPTEESEEDPEEEGPLFDIEIDGETYEVNEEELRSGYLRNEQLVKRQQELEAQFEEKQVEVEQYQQQLLDRLEDLSFESNLSLQKYKNIDWESLRSEDPEGYKVARFEYIEAQEVAQKRDAQRNQLLAMHKQAQAIKHQAYLKSQHALAEKLVPEIKDEAAVSKILDYGKSIGFTEDELRGIADAKVLFLLNQSRLYAESQVKRKEAQDKKVSKDLPPVIKPGAPRSVAQESGRKVRDLQTRLKSSHDIRDAAKLLENFV